MKVDLSSLRLEYPDICNSTTTMERARLSANHANQASIVEKSPDLERLCEQHMEKIATINVTVPSMSKKGIPSVVVVADVIVWR